MSKKPPSLVQFNFSEDIPTNPQIKEVINTVTTSVISGSHRDPVTGEENPNFIYEEQEEELIEDEPIKFEEKEEINAKELFDDYNPPAKSCTKPGSVACEKKPRKPMSAEHKAKLAVAREKAMESRKAKAIERKKMKELENEEKELLKTQKVKRVQKLKEEVNDEKPLETSTPIKTTGLSKKDLEDAQLEAIMKYEAIRKQRKEEKKQAKMIEEGKQKMLNQINRATGGVSYRYRDGSNRFDNCY